MLESDGFLSSGVEQYREKCRSRYSSWFDLIEEINRFGQSLLSGLRPDPADKQRSIAALLYIRVLGHSQGSVLLIERCMEAQSEILVRACLEAVFGLLAVVERPDTAELLIKADRHRRLELLKSAQRQEDLSSSTRHDLEEPIRAIKEDIKQSPSPEMKTSELAERAGEGSLYRSAYKLLSLPVHSNLRDLERHICIDSQGNPTAIQWGPHSDGLDKLLMLVGEVLLLAVKAVCRLFRLGNEEMIQSLRVEFAALAHGVRPDVSGTGEP